MERADFDGPFAALTSERTTIGHRSGSVLATVLIEEFVVADFEIQMEDEGIGMDDRSVISANVTLILNGTVWWPVPITFSISIRSGT